MAPLPADANLHWGLMIALAVIYTAATYWAALYGLTFFLWLYLWLQHREHQPGPPNVGRSALPSVTVQVPVYNELHVVERVIDAVAALDYPRDRLQIQILDDSDDGTTRVARQRVGHHQNAGLDIALLHRDTREGYKAGALAWGLRHARGEYVAVFDADFAPRPDFLLRTVPHFLSRPRLGMLQTRWSHLNAGYSWLTGAQALALDGHFAIEQVARSRSGLPMRFDGSAGIWRRRCIVDAGGWQADTLCEDLDLSYRAQLAGWECHYLPRVDVPAELVPQMEALKRQRSRWERGSAQCLRKLAGPLLSSRRLRWWQKVMGLVDLSSHVGRVLTIVMLLASLPMVLAPQELHLPLRGVGVVVLGPLLMCILGQSELRRPDGDWWKRLRAYPVLALVEMGLAWCSTKAFWQGITRWGGTFARTPKFQLEGRDGQWSSSIYRLGLDGSIAGEIGLAAYALVTAGAALLTRRYSLLPFAALCAVSFGTVAGTSLAQALAARRGRTRSRAIGPEQAARPVRPSAPGAPSPRT